MTNSLENYSALHTDELTGIRNVRAFNEALESLLVSSAEGGVPLCLVLFDIDKFKSVNDDHGGHATGDEALVAVASIAAKCSSGKGTVFRLGGDEFGILLPNHVAEEGAAVAERIRRAINGAPLTSRNLTLSVSMGVAEFPTHADAAGLRQAADKAAYDSKNRGRNLVRVFGEPPPAKPGPREPERRPPSPKGFTDDERRNIRENYFRRRVAYCPRDEAILDVHVLNEFGRTTKGLMVRCPLCGTHDRFY